MNEEQVPTLTEAQLIESDRAVNAAKKEGSYDAPVYWFALQDEIRHGGGL